MPLGAKNQDMLVVSLFDLILGHVDWNKQMLDRIGPVSEDAGERKIHPSLQNAHNLERVINCIIVLILASIKFFLNTFRNVRIIKIILYII